jgi:hypothetical protein
MQRFTCVAVPIGKWMVCDSQANEPATLGGKPLVDMSTQRAETARDILERIQAADKLGRESTSPHGP